MPFSTATKRRYPIPKQERKWYCQVGRHQDWQNSGRVGYLSRMPLNLTAANHPIRAEPRLIVRWRASLAAPSPQAAAETSLSPLPVRSARSAA